MLAECLATITHLMKFEETRTSLLLVSHWGRKPLRHRTSGTHALLAFTTTSLLSCNQGCVTDRLQRALDRGWIAKGLVEEAKRVQKALEDCQQKEMEAAFGRVAGASS